MFSQACHSVHNRSHCYSVTSHPWYSAVGTHPTSCLFYKNTKCLKKSNFKSSPQKTSGVFSVKRHSFKLNYDNNKMQSPDSPILTHQTSAGSDITEQLQLSVLHLEQFCIQRQQWNMFEMFNLKKYRSC